MKPIDHINNYCGKYHRVTTMARPNWILADFSDSNGVSLNRVVFDFKNDEARRAFGALCHVLYTDPVDWYITMHRLPGLNPTD